MPLAPRSGRVLERVDHLVYAAPDLEAAVGALEATLGARAEPGGRHPAEGTRNFLLALGPAVYLEIVGPDRGGEKLARPRWFGIDGLDRPKLAVWAARGEDLDGIVTMAAVAGVKLGPVSSGSRERPDGELLSWRFTDPRVIVEGGVVPFFIDWGRTPHPALSTPQGATLETLRAEHPEPRRARNALSAVGLDLPVALGAKPALIATIRTPRGIVELR